MTRVLSLPSIRFDRTSILKLTHRFSSEIGTCLLYSGGQFDSASRSYLCLFPFDYVCVQGNMQWRTKPEDPESRITLHLSNPWEALKTLLSEFSDSEPFPKWVGYFGYEMGAFADEERKIPYQQANTPDAYFQRSAIVLRVDHQTEQGTVFISEEALYFLSEQNSHWVRRLSDLTGWEELLKSLPEVDLGPETGGPIELVRPMESPEFYRQKVEQAQELIRSGDIYQVNLSQQFQFSGNRNPFSLFYQLAQKNPAPFSAYLRLNDFAIVSSSPERFLQKRGNQLETRPIKGTIPRGKTPEEDLRNKETLLNCPKERAELLMITDLMRNDLGKISDVGSVKTDQIWRCEGYTNVYHLLSIIRSQVLPGLTPIDIIRSCFPGGSITGCPKLSAMEVIYQLEQRPRGIYTGSIGYLEGNGDFDFNIAIRTLVVESNRINVQLGGAIVADSDPQKEYEETLHKGASIFEILGWAEGRRL